MSFQYCDDPNCTLCPVEMVEPTRRSSLKGGPLHPTVETIAVAIAEGPLDVECPNEHCRSLRHEPCMEVTGLGRRQRRDGAHVMRQATAVAAALAVFPDRAGEDK